VQSHFNPGSRIKLERNPDRTDEVRFRGFPPPFRLRTIWKILLFCLVTVFVVAVGGIPPHFSAAAAAWAGSSVEASSARTDPAIEKAATNLNAAAVAVKHAGPVAKQPASKRNDMSKKEQPENNSPFPEFSANHGPINIRSDSLSLDYKNNTVLFNGHVRVVQAGGVLTSNSLLVKYNKSHEIERAVANGNVRMSQGTRWVTSDHAVLNQTDHTIVLTGNPVAHNGDDQVTGSKITVYLQSGKSVVDGNARAVFFPRPSKNGDNQGTGQTVAGAHANGGNQVFADPAR
jgi:lipopolysaccharide transport protein LptA